MVKILIKDLRKEYEDTIAVDNFNLFIREKEIVCLLGPSGCGKTTTLKCIAGLEKPTSGEIYFDEILVNDIPPEKRNVGLVFQNYAIFPHMTAYDNIAFPLKIRKFPKDEIHKEVENIAEFLEIKQVLDVKGANLSLSNKQKVAIARTLISKPNVLLFDEPLSNIDARLRTIMRSEIKKIVKKMGKTAIYVTHDQLEAMAIADKIALMNRGRIQQYDTPHRIYSSPANMFVAHFIGSPSMNFLDCSFKEDGNGAYLIHEAFKLDVSEFREFIIKRAQSSELVLGIRPEHVLIRDEHDKESIKGEVELVEPLGLENIVTLKIGKTTTIKALIPTPTFRKEKKSCYITIAKDKIHIFDKKTEEAIL